VILELASRCPGSDATRWPSPHLLPPPTEGEAGTMLPPLNADAAEDAGARSVHASFIMQREYTCILQYRGSTLVLYELGDTPRVAAEIF